MNSIDLEFILVLLIFVSFALILISKKGYKPELIFDFRREILLSIKYVHEVIPSPRLIDENFLDSHNIDLLKG